MSSRGPDAGPVRALLHLDGLYTTSGVVDRMAREFPDHPAVVSEDRGLTFAQLRLEVRRAAAAMIARDVQPGDAVAIWSPNTWHWVIAALATHYAGAVLVPVNVSYTAGELCDVLSRTGTPLLIAGGARAAHALAELDRAAAPALRHIVWVPPAGMSDSDESSWDHFLGGPAAPMSDVDARAAAVNPDDISDILFTSGTTGRSKGVLSTHRQSLSVSRSWAQTATLNMTDRYLCVNPFSHNFGYKAGILACLQTGAALIPQGAFDPERSLRTVQEQRITVLPGPPTLYRALLDHPERTACDLGSLRVAVTGAAMVPVALIERMQRELDIDVVLTAYGLTEACGFGTMCRPGDDPLTIATTVGRPIADFEVRIDDPDTTGTGEVLLRGPNVMLGYLDDAAATGEVIDADGWLHTGDVGTVDDAGNLRITDRLTDMYITGGLNVYPAEVEQVLARLDGVAEAALVGVPDQDLGEVGRAFIVARPGVALDKQSVVAHARQHLAGFKTPRYVTVVDDLPRNIGGKVLKTVLRDSRLPASDRVRPSRPQGQGGPPLGPVEVWIADAWQTLLTIDRPGRRDRFTDVGGDSLSAVELSRLVKARFGVAISVDRFADRPTVAALAEDIQTGVNELRNPVISLRDDGDGPVYLMIPGWAGYAANYAPLAHGLAGPCEVVALSLTDLESGPEPARSAIRSAALAAVRRQAAAGRPISVMGYSFGALVAADLVGWLAEQGVSIGHLYLLDPNPLESSKPRSGLRGPALRALQKLSPRAYIALLRWRNPELAASAPTLFDPAANAAVASLIELHKDEEAEASYFQLEEVYRDGSIHLPPIPVLWIQSREMSLSQRTATAVFGTPVAQIEREPLDVDFHADVLQKSHANVLADLINRRTLGAAASSRPVGDPIHLRRNGFDPAPELAEIRASTGVEIVPTAFGATTYVLTRYDDVKTMLADYKRFATSPPFVVSGERSPSAGGQDDPRAGNLMVFDPPEHTRLRRMLAAQFTAQRVARLEQLIVGIVDGRLAAMESAGGPADLLQIFALPISSLVICELLGVPYEDREEFQRYGVRGTDVTISYDERAAIERERQAYMASLVERTRRRPGEGILGMLVREHGSELTDAELVGIGSLLLLAGHETTATMISLGTLALLRHPDQLALLRGDPEAVDPAIEELLRWLTIIQTGQTRFTTAEVEVAGVVIPARQPVYAAIPAANRDPAFIDNPEALDIRRRAPGHLAFGHGVHRCLGAPLARMQLRIAIPALIRRFPDLALAEPFDQVQFRTSNFIYGLNSLQVSW